MKSPLKPSPVSKGRPFRPFNTPFHDAANEVMVSTYTGGKENARANGYERHPILLRNAIADALKAAYLAGKRSRSKSKEARWPTR